MTAGVCVCVCVCGRRRWQRGLAGRWGGGEVGGGTPLSL